MLVKYLILYVTFLTVTRNCNGNNNEEHHDTTYVTNHAEDDHKSDDHEELTMKKEELKIQKEEPIVKKLPGKLKSLDSINVKTKPPQLNLRLDETAFKNSQKSARPVSKLQQEIQISQPRKQELRPIILVPVQHAKVKKPQKSSIPNSGFILSEEFNRQLNRNNHKHDNDDNCDDTDDKVEPKSPDLKIPEDMDAKSKPQKTTKQLQSKKKVTKPKDEETQETTTSSNKPIKTPEVISDDQSNKPSNNSRTIKNSENVVLVNDSKVDNDQFTHVENIISEIQPVEVVEKVVDSPIHNVTSEIEPAGTIKPTKVTNEIRNAKTDKSLAGNDKVITNPANNLKTKLITALENKNKQEAPSDDKMVLPFNILDESIDQLVINNEDVQELSERPNKASRSQDNPQFAANTCDATDQYYNVANYDNLEQSDNWQTSEYFNQAANMVPNTYGNLEPYRSNVAYPNVYTNNVYNYNNKNYRPDNSYTPPPYKYPYEDQFGRVIKSYSQLGNKNNNNQQASGNGWNQNYNWYCNPYQNPSYPISRTKFNEVRIPNTDSDRIWRHWHKTQVVINKNGKPYQNELKRLGSYSA